MVDDTSQDTLISYFEPQLVLKNVPHVFRNPFDNNPDSEALRARDLLQHKLDNELSNIHPFFCKDEGKMFGVLVVQNSEGKVGYLSAFSGMLGKQWLIEGFVPPVFHVETMSLLLQQGEQELNTLSSQINILTDNKERKKLINECTVLSQQSDEALLALKAVHKHKKETRKEKRLKLLDQQHVKDELLHLSLQSQDDKREIKALKIEFKNKAFEAEQNLHHKFEREISELSQQRKQLSQGLHKQIFDLYQMKNVDGLVKPINDFFEHGLAPGGAGDCAAPKLIQYALTHQLKILSLCEFWWGASPKKEIRHHQHSYPPCRSRCHPIIPFMLKGLDVESFKTMKQLLIPKVIYEDADIVVLNKPEGLLSIPGKQEHHSVQSWLTQRYDSTQKDDELKVVLVHRLDQATSGVMLAAKNKQAHKYLQKQFIQRTIKKRYVAVLAKRIKQKDIEINLPLRVDLEDRPRQLVCFEHGKQALTNMVFIAFEGDYSRVYFYPKTGRTHQLRLHAAHELGLNCPIVGDSLYGIQDKRLMLHAEKIEFVHPKDNNLMIFKVDVPF